MIHIDQSFLTNFSIQCKATASKEEYIQWEKDQKTAFEEVLSQLAISREEGSRIRPRVVNPMPSFSCNNGITQSFFYFAANVHQIAKDTLTCGFKKSSPEHPVLVPQEAFQGMDKARRDHHRNLGILTCGTCCITCCIPLATYFFSPPPFVLTAAMISTLTGTFITGQCTYCFTDGFRAEELTIAAQLQKGFDNVAKYLWNEWRKSTTQEEKNRLKTLCEGIAPNCEFVKQDMVSLGILPEHAEEIMASFTRVVASIRNNSYTIVMEP